MTRSTSFDSARAFRSYLYRSKGKRHGRLLQKPNSCHYFKFDRSGANRFVKCPSHICSVNKASTPIKCQYSSGMFGGNRSVMWDDSAADRSGFKFSGNLRRGSFLGFREDIDRCPLLVEGLPLG